MITKIKLNKVQKIAYYLIKEKKYSLTIGSGGTGKSTLIEAISQTNSGCVCLSYTGNSALNIKGQTIHSFFGFSIDEIDSESRVKELAKIHREKIKGVKTLLIDEISMLNIEIFENVDKVMRLARRNTSPFGGVRLVMFADFCQLESISIKEHTNESEPFVFESIIWKKMLVSEISLIDPVRVVDKDYSDLIEMLRIGKFVPGTLKELNSLISSEKKAKSTILTSTNRRAKNINLLEMSKLKTQPITVKARISKGYTSKNNPNDNLLEIKVGMQLMFIVNSANYKNGQLGTLVGFNRETKTARVLLNNGKTIRVDPYKWGKYEYLNEKASSKKMTIKKQSKGYFEQMPFVAAYAITIHKAQGKTIDKVHLDLKDGLFASGQLYVALSRVRQAKDISISRDLTRTDVIINNKAVRKTIYIEEKTMNKLNGYSIRYKEKEDTFYLGSEVSKSESPTAYIRSRFILSAIENDSIDSILDDIKTLGISSEVNVKGSHVIGVKLSYMNKTFPLSKVIKISLLDLSHDYDISLKTKKESSKKDSLESNNRVRMINSIFN